MTFHQRPHHLHSRLKFNFKKSLGRRASRSSELTAGFSLTPFASAGSWLNTASLAPEARLCRRKLHHQAARLCCVLVDLRI